MLKKNRLRLGAVATLALAGVAFSAVSAYADPTPAGTFKPIVGVGSDTTQLASGEVPRPTSLPIFIGTSKSPRMAAPMKVRATRPSCTINPLC